MRTSIALVTLVAVGLSLANARTTSLRKTDQQSLKSPSARGLRAIPNNEEEIDEDTDVNAGDGDEDTTVDDNGDVTGRISGGSNAVPNRYPYHAQMHIVGGGFFLAHMCGGVLIAPQVIATAATCIPAPENAQSIIFNVGYVCGGANNCGVPIETGWGDYAVVHPDFDAVKWYKNNIILLVLRDPIRNIRPIDPDDGAPSFGDDLHGVGLGFVDDNEGRSDVLQDIALELVDATKCANDYQINPSEVVGKVVCTRPRGGKAGGHCGYDMGSGVFRVGRGGSSDKLVGIHSFRDAASCSRPDFADGHSSIASVFPWIQDVICPLDNNRQTLSWCRGHTGGITPPPSSGGGVDDITIVIPGRPPSPSPPSARPPTPTPPTPRPPTPRPPTPTPPTENNQNKSGCGNDKKVRFKLSFATGQQKKCKWLSKKKSRQDAYCSSGLSDARFKCQKTCKTCGLFN